MNLLSVCLASFFLVSPPALAQSPDTAGNPAKPADAPASGTAETPSKEKKPKKVWTNDELASVKGDVSVVGARSSSSSKDGNKQSPSPQGAANYQQKQIERYRKQIQQYQSQIDAIDVRIDQLKNFHGQNATPSGGVNPNEGYAMIPIDEQIKQLEAKKKQLQSKIDDTENEARKNGIEPGDLR